MKASCLLFLNSVHETSLITRCNREWIRAIGCVATLSDMTRMSELFRRRFSHPVESYLVQEM